MSKAYDRIKWKFLEEMMRTFGFGEKWIATIMKCVSSIIYLVLINGQAFYKFKPSRSVSLFKELMWLKSVNQLIIFFQMIVSFSNHWKVILKKSIGTMSE